MATYASLTQQELMTLTGVSITTCRNMVLKGVFVKNPDGSFDPQPSISNYIEWLKKRHGSSGELGGEDRDPDTEYRRQKARQARLQADQLEGTLIAVGEVAWMWESHIHATKSKLTALPDAMIAEILPLLPEGTPVEEVRGPLERLVTEALEEMSRDQDLDDDDDGSDSTED